MSPDEQLRYAKKEIENAPLVVDDPELFAPLFRNVSVFKRWESLQIPSMRLFNISLLSVQFGDMLFFVGINWIVNAFLLTLHIC